MSRAVYVFPTILIALDLGAAVVYLTAAGDWRKCVYWLCAAILTTVVTF